MVTSTGANGEIIDRDKMIIAHLYLAENYSKGINVKDNRIDTDDYKQELSLLICELVDKRNNKYSYNQWLKYLHLKLKLYYIDYARSQYKLKNKYRITEEILYDLPVEIYNIYDNPLIDLDPKIIDMLTAPTKLLSVEYGVKPGTINQRRRKLKRMIYNKYKSAYC